MTEQEIIEQFNSIVAADKVATAGEMRDFVESLKAKGTTLYAQGFPEVYSIIVQNLTSLADRLDPPAPPPVPVQV